ncbi:hypothetical protein AMATHDRAFT_46558 [Amanita thiersii Skay4041]|uniref:SH3 domain-containing protein n=1 Tax=Amanita thiersii Skay4041 TaxID=703135 RepID=A0A2A9NS80_9AGAR|nr:hypothetical protein AMATHDRAFT_46558 [Amanita thiersii Skay4041]
MSARRQPSATSLSKFARAHSPIPPNRSLDFCNAFWGIGDGGVDVLFARMRGATRTIDELRTFWKERAAIEEDYAKRLAKLAKTSLGKDEIGELRNSLDTVRLETDKQAEFHLTLAQQIRNDLEAPTTTFHNEQLRHKKIYQANIEKEFKAKQLQESYVVKARDKYEADCVRINSYAAQSTIIQGKELERVTQKLERAQQTVQANERDFANFAKALQDTVHKWEQNWKNFCDSCQDLEEQRIEFMKDNLWAYANAVSTVCVADDESCEKMRLALEQLEPDKDMENFVRDYGTGNQVPDPPQFVNYNTPDAIPSASARPSTRPSNFIRSSNRDHYKAPTPVPPDDEPLVNTAGIGAGGGLKRADTQSQAQAPLSRQPTHIRSGSTSAAGPQYTPQVNGTSSTPGAPSTSAISTDPSARRRSTANYPVAESSTARSNINHDPQAEPIDPNAETFIKVGNAAYKVDLTKDPQQAGPSTSRSSMSTRPGGSIDPLARQLEELKIAVQNSGSGRRNTISKSPQDMGTVGQSSRKSTGEPIASPSGLSPPGSSFQNQAQTRDYRNSADMVVGVHPSASRSVSPNPPTAAFMVPKPSTSPAGSEIVQRVTSEYGQSLPGERRSISRPSSRRNSFVGTPGGQVPVNAVPQSQNLARPPSQLGHAGVGAHGSRSVSPQPLSRGTSPAPGRNSYIAPPPPPNINRAPSPNSVGIALDSSGRVSADTMAGWYEQQKHQSQQYPQQSQQSQQQRASMPQHQGQYTPINTAPTQQLGYRPSMIASTTPVNNHVTQVPPSMQPGYGTAAPAYQPHAPAAPAPQTYIPPPPPHSVYQQPPTPYQQAPPPLQQLPPQQQQQHQPQLQQQQMYQTHPANQYQLTNGVQRGGSVGGGVTYYGNGMHQHQQQAPQQQMYGAQMHQHQQQHHQQQQLVSPQNTYLDGRMVGRSPSPQPMQVLGPQQQQLPPQSLNRGFAPTGQTTEDGQGILFYVKALYDYTATIDEEFDFQAGDIIAVTATPEDGWWSGELLDENRRQKGRHVFPSNFVCLF